MELVKSAKVQGDLRVKSMGGLDIVPVSRMVVKLIRVDHWSLPEVDGFHHLVVFNDYFNKLLVAKLIMNKKARTISKLLYKLMCRNGCFSIQKEFGNKITRCFYCLTCVQQRIKNVYHLQTNSLVERQIKITKTLSLRLRMIMTVQWPYVTEGTLFSFHASKSDFTILLLSSSIIDFSFCPPTSNTVYPTLNIVTPMILFTGNYLILSRPLQSQPEKRSMKKLQKILKNPRKNRKKPTIIIIDFPPQIFEPAAKF